MSHISLLDLAKQVSEETGFVIDKEIYRAGAGEELRNVIFLGTYEDKPAVLKLYNDPQLSEEGLSLARFNESNHSTLLVAPTLYRYATLSARHGWLIMEALNSGAFFTQPVSDKEEFAKLFLEYRANFPSTSHRPVLLTEQLSASEYHSLRINRWFEMANAAEAQRQQNGEEAVLKGEEFIPRFEKALQTIRQEFSGRSLVWSHGHFKPHDLYKVSSEKYYLTDFAHTKFYPEGYELAFIIWADWFISGDWKLKYEEWKQGVNEWLEVLRPVAAHLGYTDYDNLMKASLLERILGTLLADICANQQMPREEQTSRIKLLYQLLDELTA